MPIWLKVPVNKKTIAAAFISMLLLSALAGALLVKVGTANPGMYMYPFEPHAVVLVQMPVNQTIHNANDVNLTFRLDLSDWIPSQPIFNPSYSFSSLVQCYLDECSVWETVRCSPEEYVFSVPLTNLSDGLHKVTVEAKTNGTHFVSVSSNNWGLSNAPVNDSSGIVYFTIDTATPQVSLLSPEMKTQKTSNMSLVFVLNETASLIAYSLDGQGNVTIPGNATLTGLAGGAHNVTVYAWDEAGNVGASETITFTVAVAEPFQATLIMASVALVAIVGAGLVTYFKKRDRKG